MRAWPAAVLAVALLGAAPGCKNPKRSSVLPPETRRAIETNVQPLRPRAGVGDRVVRFIAVGDTGTGDEGEFRTGAAMAKTCAKRGCDFVIMLGDNIYEDGVETPDDPEWGPKFEEPFRDVDVPFYVALGNHDYGGEVLGERVPGVGNEWERGVYQIEYARTSKKYVLPAPFYTVRWGNVGLIALDTNSLLYGHKDFGDQRVWYPRALAALSDARWKIAFGHHPYRSNGVHGNAGDYDLIQVRNKEVRIPIKTLDGTRVRRFFDQELCGTVDIYFSGHDHNLQWLDAPDALCGTELVVSGAGGKLKNLKGETTPAYWQDDTEYGFFYGVIEGDKLTGRFIDADGNVRFERSFERGQAHPPERPVAGTPARPTAR